MKIWLRPHGLFRLRRLVSQLERVRGAGQKAAAFSDADKSAPNAARNDPSSSETAVAMERFRWLDTRQMLDRF